MRDWFGFVAEVARKVVDEGEENGIVLFPVLTCVFLEDEVVEDEVVV